MVRGSPGGIKRDPKGLQAHWKQCWELGMGLCLLNLVIGFEENRALKKNWRNKMGQTALSRVQVASEAHSP